MEVVGGAPASRGANHRLHTPIVAGITPTLRRHSSIRPTIWIRAARLIPYVADHSDEDLDEMAFTDAINRNLRLGRLLLLIVGTASARASRR